MTTQTYTHCPRYQSVVMLYLLTFLVACISAVTLWMCRLGEDYDDYRSRQACLNAIPHKAAPLRPAPLAVECGGPPL